MSAQLLDFGCYVVEEPQKPLHNKLYLHISGIHCAACMQTIEGAFFEFQDVSARLNLSTERLLIEWQSGGKQRANEWVALLKKLGYEATPFDPSNLKQAQDETQKQLLSCLAVAAFATGNVMLFSQILWFSPEGAVFGYTKDLMHWVMALIALPACAYAGQPFFQSAYKSLKNGRTNMDVPISLAIILASALSIYETITHGDYVYFDASVMLLFFLLIGRFFDHQARGQAKKAAQGLLTLLEGTARVFDQNGKLSSKKYSDLLIGDKVLVVAGEKFGADGVIFDGDSLIDTHLLTGESLPRPAYKGDHVYAGTINLSKPLSIEVASTQKDTVLSEVLSLMETAEQGQAHFVRLADRVARLYAPFVHLTALVTLLGWVFLAKAAWEPSLLNALAVLIITCPCALALAVPVVQVVASSRLFKEGILLKSAKGLETLAKVDTIIFDKTGTLTFGEPRCVNIHDLDPKNLGWVRALSERSYHPMAKALFLAIGKSNDQGDVKLEQVEEHAGKGMQAFYDGSRVSIGQADFVGRDDTMGLKSLRSSEMVLYVKKGMDAAIALRFEDIILPDVAEVVKQLKMRGLRLEILSGDHQEIAEKIGKLCDIQAVYANCGPTQKVAHIEALKKAGHRVLMVGDGLNDAAALSVADVSFSPSTGVDIAQNAADYVARGRGLRSVLIAFDTARKTQSLVWQNIGFSLLYNLVAIPFAVFGYVTPLVAALAMSGSSLVVILNALRLKGRFKGH